tara:strand:- start:363 stop:473 length:111 start_codon:yes stop_codon:yes gene_type:complete
MVSGKIPAVTTLDLLILKLKQATAAIKDLITSIESS